MEEKRPFQVGDVVAYFGPFDREASAIFKVARVMKRWIELSDGSRFDLNGHSRTGAFSRAHVQHAVEADAVAVKRRRVYSKIMGKVDHLKMVDKTLPIAQLEAVDKTLTELLEAVGEKP